MKRIFVRIGLFYKRLLSKKILKGILYLLIFVMIFSSFFISNLSQYAEDELSKNMDLHVVLGSSANNGYYSEVWEKGSSKYEFVDLMNNYLDKAISIGERAGCYYDINISFLNSNCFFINGESLNNIVNGGKLSKDINTFTSMMENYELYKQYLVIDESLDPWIVYYQNENLSDVFSDEGVYRYYAGLYASTNFDWTAVASEAFFDIKNNNIQLTEGRSFNRNELYEGMPVCILEEGSFALVEENGKIIEKSICVGDVLEFEYDLTGWGNDEHQYETYQMTVIGFYSSNQKEDINTISKSKAYVPYNFWNKIWNKSYDILKESGKNFYYQFQATNTYYEVDNLRNLHLLIKIINEMKDDTMSYTASTGDKAVLLGCISAFSKNIDYLAYILLVLCLMFSIAFTSLEVYYKKKEIRLLLSFGEEKKNIILQNLIEIIIHCCFGVLVALLISKTITTISVRYFLGEEFNNLLLTNNYEYIYSKNCFVFTNQQLLCLFVFIFLLLAMNTLLLCFAINRLEEKALYKGE